MHHLVYITTSFKPGAIPNIFSEILPPISKRYKISVVVFEEEPDPYAIYLSLKEKGISFHFLRCKKYDIWGQYLKLRNCLKAIQPDIIHSHLGRADIISAWVNRGQIPHIATLHSVRSNFSPVTLRMFRLVDPYITVRTGVSQGVIDDFYATNFLRSLHRIIYNPVSIDRLQIVKSSELLRKEFGIPDHATIIACIGRLVPAKGHIFLLQAFAELHTELKNLYLVIAGDGPLYRKLQHTATRLNINQQVCFIGFYTPVSDIINLAHIVVFPSLWEGMGLVPIESLLLSKPVIVSNLTVLRECIPEGAGVLFVEPGNAREIVKAMKKMLQKSSTDLEAYFKRVIPQLTHKYDANTIAEQYLDVYSMVISKNT